MYLLDSDVVAALRHPTPHGAVLDWLRGVPANRLHVSAVTVGEIQAAVEVARERDRRRSRELEEWLLRLRCAYGVLAADAATFREWARLTHERPDADVGDGMIAATAVVHHLTVATGHVENFEPFDVPTFNPFEFEP